MYAQSNSPSRKSSSAGTLRDRDVLDLFRNGTPLQYAGGDVNLYRYVGNRPTIAVDPSGLVPPNYDPMDPRKPMWPGGPIPANFPNFTQGSATVPTPAPAGPAAPIFPSPAVANAPAGLLGHWSPFASQSRKNRLVPIPGVTVLPRRDAPGNIGGGTGTAFLMPAAGGNPVGTKGCFTCIGVVIKCPGGVAVYHFNTMNSPADTLDNVAWPKGCTAIVCGGDDSDVSNHLADSVLSALKAEGITVVGVTGKGGCGVLPGDGWCETDK